MTDQYQRWSRVADAINARMRELAMTQAELKAKSSISDLTIRQLQRNESSSYRSSTLAKIATALGWTPDSIELILDGEAPRLSPRAWRVADETSQPLPPHLVTWVSGLSAEDRRLVLELVSVVAHMAATVAEGVIEQELDQSVYPRLRAADDREVPLEGTEAPASRPRPEPNE